MKALIKKLMCDHEWQRMYVTGITEELMPWGRLHNERIFGIGKYFVWQCKCTKCGKEKQFKRLYEVKRYDKQ